MYGQAGWRHTPGWPGLDSYEKSVKSLGVQVTPPTAKVPARRGVNRAAARASKAKLAADDSGYSSKHKKAVMNYGP